MPSIVFLQISQKIVTRRFVFDTTKVDALKAKVAAPSLRTYALTGVVNLRPRLMPPLPKYSFGNVSGLLWAMLDNNKDEIIDLPDLVCQLRKGIEQSTDNNLTTKATYLMRAEKDEMDVYRQNTRDGDGVEVWTTLKEEDMALFQGDPELLAFASPNPSAL
ncbi:hypothetical protein ACSBR2_027015 [Camellia fascicularis]